MVHMGDTVLICMLHVLFENIYIWITPYKFRGEQEISKPYIFEGTWYHIWCMYIFTTPTIFLHDDGFVVHGSLHRTHSNTLGI